MSNRAGPSRRHLLLAAAGGLAPALILAGFVATGAPGERPPFLGASEAPTRETPLAPPHGALQAAGSGPNVPLTRRLAERFAAQGGGAIVVHASIGSRGGILAASDGAVDLGLISRPLGKAELALGLEVVPYARVEVLLAAHPGDADERLTPEDVLAIYRGTRKTWHDGSPITVLLREVGDSGQEALARALPGFGEVVAEAHRSRRFRVIYREHDMKEALLSTPGAIGVFDKGLAKIEQAPLRLLPIEGVTPTRDLAFVRRRGDPRADAFLAFVRSPAGREIIGEGGYLPLPVP